MPRCGRCRCLLSTAPDSDSAIEHVPGVGQAGRFWYLGPVSRAFPDEYIGLSPELPNFTQSDGTPLLSQYRETDFDFVFRLARDFEEGEALTFSGGTSSAWPGVTLFELPVTFQLDELFDRAAGQFSAYTGSAVVADITTITFVPEPVSVITMIAAFTTVFTSRRSCGHWYDGSGHFTGAPAVVS